MPGGRRDAESAAAKRHVTDEALDAARFGLDRRTPAQSARRVLHAPQIAALALVAAGVWWGLQREPAAMAAGAHWAALTLFASFVFLRLFAAAASMMLPARTAAGWTDPLPAYTVLCPLYREASSVPALVAALDRLDYPADRRDVKLIVEADDGATLSACMAERLPAGFSIVIVPVATPRTKPKALNYALAQARGEFVVIFDAEDAPHPSQLRAALDAFAQDDRLGAVQAPLLIDNADASWIASQFAAEYAIQFRGLLPLLAHLKAPFPLGGASNHFRRAALDDVGGWDPFNVTEYGGKNMRIFRVLRGAQ